MPPNPMFGLLKKSTQDVENWTARLKSGLSRTREAIGGLFVREKVDETLFEELETALISADCSVAATARLIDALRERVGRENVTDAERAKQLLKEELYDLVRPLQRTLDPTRAKPLIIMVAGVNGSGKTTSIGKLAKYFQTQGRSVLLAAGDTFRAAAREQLAVWGQRNGVEVISQQSGDPGAVMYDAVNAAVARKIDIVLADTAGRLPTQLHLMDEIRKVKRVISKVMPEAPHEVLLVLDANTGQNTLTQVKAFDAAVGVTGLVLTKLDGTAKGGVVVALAHERAGFTRDIFSAQEDPSGNPRQKPIPLYFVGVGEGTDDLRPFDAREFVEALVD